jgi:mono/diheme cytochrome c family protein
MKPRDPQGVTQSQSAKSAAAHLPGVPPGVADLAPHDPDEHVEPGENQPPLSVWLVSFIGALFFWGGLYVQRFSGGYDAMVYDENASPGQVKSNAVQTVDPYTLGKRVFANTCAKCHQLDGQGVAGQYPPLAGSEWALAAGPARMIRIVLDGLQGPIKVKGVDFNNNMTAHRDALTDPHIAAVITYVRSQKEWGHNASPVTPEQVADIRAQTKSRAGIGAWTAAELMALPEALPPAPAPAAAAPAPASKGP